MNLSEIRTEIQFRTNDSTLTSTNIDRWVNLAIKQWSAEADWYELIDLDSTQTTTASTIEYNLPTDISKIISVKVGTDSTTTEPEATEHSYVSYFNKDVDTSGPFYYVNPESGDVGIIPTPGETGLPIYIKYYKIPADISAIGDEPPFSEKFHELVVFFALKKYWEYADDYGKVNFYDAEWKNMLERMRTELLKQSRSQVSRVLDVRELLGSKQPRILNSIER